MSFTEHLRELRQRLVISLVAVLVIALAMFVPAHTIIPWMIKLYFGKIELHIFAPQDAIVTEFKFSLYAAIVLGLPVVVSQIWLFIVPAFHPKTRRQVYSFVLPSLILGLCGVAFAHFFVMPAVVRGLVISTGDIAVPTYGLEQTMNFVLILLLAFALIFQLPVVLIMLARIGLINVAMLQKYRRYALMGALLLGGVGAPDASPITMLLLAAPMYVLYEASVLIIRVLEKSWQRQALTP
jgi:sec-independent protein translocase protein TatC